MSIDERLESSTGSADLRCAGMCLVRIEDQGAGDLLITVMVNTDVRRPRWDRTVRVTEVDQAMEVVARFLGRSDDPPFGAKENSS